MNEKHPFIRCQTCHEPLQKISDDPEQWRCPHWDEESWRCKK